MKNNKAVFIVILSALSAAWAGAQTPYPPLCVEVNSDHPLFIFETPEPEPSDAAAYAQTVLNAWNTLPPDLKPFSTLLVAVKGAEHAARQEKYRALLTPLQEAGVPVVIRIADGNPRQIFPLESAKELVRGFTCVKGLQVKGLSFEDYYEFGADDPLGAPPNVQWLIGAIDMAAQYGRFVSIQLGELRWPRIMSNTWCKPLYDKMRQCAPYVIPTADVGGEHTVPRVSALLGFWLEGAVPQWGIAVGTAWYADAHFLKPGEFGASDSPAAMPPALYRALILNGVMTGAAAYTFDDANSLWFGLAREYWDTAIYPLLAEIVERRYIPRRDFVTKEAVRVAYQLGPARTSQEFHLNLRDIDAAYDAGFLMHGAYGVERAGQVPEVIPNTGRYYWIPLLSPYAPQEALAAFGHVVQPGVMTSPRAWKEVLDRHYEAQEPSTAFVTKIGRGIFILHTRENLYEEQTFRAGAVPAPVRGIEAHWQGPSVVLTWQPREGDVGYSVYRRILPETRFSRVVGDLDPHEWVDTGVAPTDTAAYSVTALTTALEPYEGTVNYGDYLVLSAVESRIAEEVTVGPLTPAAKSRPTTPPPDTRPKAQAWWPNFTGLTEDQIKVATSVVARIEAWDQAFSIQNLDQVMDLYSTDYEDPQGWRFQYVTRAYKWFFERYDACKMRRQIRQWNFKNLETSGQVEVLLYCRFTGVATTDPTGRTADVEAYFPRTAGGEVWVTFSDPAGVCRIVRTNPAVPNFNDLLSFSASPTDAFQLGPDIRGAAR